jgi:hypothetical protein
MSAYGQHFEAREWLQGNPNRNAFAGNHFRGSEAALTFVERLYAAGAVAVFVTNVFDEDWRIMQEGGPYADTVIVDLPQDPRQRRAIVDLCNVETEYEDGPPFYDSGQASLSLWWD